MIKADLHIHTTLSPCGSLDMSPSLIVDKALEKGLDLIAITDHNSIENSFYTKSIGSKKGLKVLFGMEAQTQEEVHILTIFDNKKDIDKFYSKIYDLLPDIKNNPEFFGDQVVVDENDNIVSEEKKLLANSLNISIEDLYELTMKNNGIFIPAHINRYKQSIIANLGFIPDFIKKMIVEVNLPFSSAYLEIDLKNLKYIVNSDAHYPIDIGRNYTIYKTNALDIHSLYKTALNQNIIRKIRNDV